MTLHELFPFGPSNVRHGDIYLARQEGTPWHQNQNQLGSHLSSGKSPGYCNLFRRFWWLSLRFFLLLSSCLQSIHLSTQRLCIYLSIAGDRDGDALRQHCWRPDLVRQRLGSGVLLLSSEVQLFYF